MFILMIKLKHSEPQWMMKHSFSYFVTINYINLCRGNSLMVKKPDRTNQIDDLVVNKENKLMWLVTDDVTGCLMIQECDAVLLGEYFLTLWRIIVLSCVRNHSSNNTEPHPRRYESSTILLWEYQMSQRVMISVERGGLFSVMVIILSVYISTGINQSSQNFCS